MIRNRAFISAHRLIGKPPFSLSPTNPRAFSSTGDKTSRLNVCTFNILAPPYKRLSSELDRESTHESLWQPRHSSIVALLQSLNLHIICLQEFWFKNVAFAQLYKSQLLSKYSFYSLPRTGTLDDGLAILIDQTELRVIDQHQLILNDIGNRVALLLHLEYQNRPLLVVNLHLTFPHYRFERHVRYKQMKRFLQLIHNYQRAKNLTDRSSIFLCGDFNCPYSNDPVYQLIRRFYRSSYADVHGNEPAVTHLTHRHEELAVDFIFYKSSDFRPIHSELIPRGANPMRWNDQTGWILSDHRPVLTTFELK